MRKFLLFLLMQEVDWKNVQNIRINSEDIWMFNEHASPQCKLKIRISSHKNKKLTKPHNKIVKLQNPAEQ